MTCDTCKRKVSIGRIHGFYPEDSTYICKECFEKSAHETLREAKKEPVCAR